MKVLVALAEATYMFQSPSLRGSGRFTQLVSEQVVAVSRVSIPFIAGQWSLRNKGARSLPIIGGVSIPFIAGQWSLRKQYRWEFS